MHVHGAHLNPTATNLYSAVEAQKTAAAKQAAAVRKKLLSSASEIEGEVEFQPVPVTGEGNEEDSPPDENQEQPHALKKSDTATNDAINTDDGGEDQSGDPISIWG